MMEMVPRDCWEYDWRDVIRGTSAALGSRREDNLLDIDGIGKCIPIVSGRAALVVGIKALQLPRGARVAVPLYCCPVVFKAIEEAGCKSCFVDIDPSTFCISAEDLSAKRSKIDAIIAVHMFGNPCDMSGIKAAANGLPVIEDCALALGSRSEDRMAGLFGTISFFSFRSGKYLSAGEGGALFSASSDIFARALKSVACLPVPSVRDELSHVLTVYTKSTLRRKPLYGLAGRRLWNVLNKRLNLAARSKISMSQIYSADLTIARRRLKQVNSAIATQRENADYYQQHLKMAPGMVCIERPGTFYNRYQFPITFPTLEQRDWIADYLAARQIDTIKYIDNVVDVATEQHGYEGDCPLSEKIIKRTLIIPSYHRLHRHDVKRIAEVLNAGWNEARAYLKGSDCHA